MFAAAAADPARLANLPADIANKASQFGVDLPIPGLGDGESGGALESLLGGSKQADQPSAEEGSGSSEEEPQPPLVPELGKQLKGLFD